MAHQYVANIFARMYGEAEAARRMGMEFIGQGPGGVSGATGQSAPSAADVWGPAPTVAEMWGGLHCRWRAAAVPRATAHSSHAPRSADDTTDHDGAEDPSDAVRCW